MDFRETNNQVLLLTVQRMVKLLNQPIDPEQAIIKLLQLLADQVSVHKPCILLPNESSKLFEITYSAGLPSKDHKCIQEQINNHIFQDNFTRIELMREQYPDVSDIVTQYSVPVKHCMFSEDLIGIPIIIDKSLTGMFVVYSSQSKRKQFKTIVNLLCISATFVNQLLQINALVRGKAKQIINNSSQYRGSIAKIDGDQYGIVGQSTALQDAVKSALRAANSQASVMLIGESGTGKEKFARMIHSAGDRAKKPFVAINCAAIPQHLLESELFGHEKGSFTGAISKHTGKFELATGGTLFLDEIGDMSLDLQSKLLRVLQENVIQRIGGTDDIPVDVRIITATHKNLQTAVNDKLFRLDLFYRLNVIRIKLPPLRDRKGDISLLTHYFWNLQNEKQHTNISLSQEAIGKLERYCWPGNIRQLENVLERAAIIMSDGNIVTALDIEQIINDESNIDLASHSLSNEGPNNTRKISYYSFPREKEVNANEDVGIVRPYSRVTVDEIGEIVEALKIAKGNKTYAAKKLGLTPRQLHYRMEKLKIDP